MERWDEEEHRRNNHNHNHEDGRSDEDKGWIPRHKDPPTIDLKKIFSVSAASRLHKGRSITVKGVISGIQPMRKMIKGHPASALTAILYLKEYMTSQLSLRASYQ
jgi:hypothetical protein